MKNKVKTLKNKTTAPTDIAFSDNANYLPSEDLFNQDK